MKLGLFGDLPVGGLFAELEAEHMQALSPDWEPIEPPSLEGIDNIQLDFETTGLRWWDHQRCRPIGFGLGLPDGRDFYFSWGHRGNAPRHDEAVMLRWCQEQLKGKTITNANIKFENHVAREWGFSFEDQGCQLYDVQHMAALLDDHRRQFSQEVLCEEFLPEERKVKTVNGHLIDERDMAGLPPGIAAVRATSDVRQVRLLSELFLPRLQKEELLKVLDLESDCIYATCEMEKNGAKLNVEKLRRWRHEARQAYEQGIFELNKRTGLKFNPDSAESWEKLFKLKGLTNVEMTKGKNPRPSFTGSVINNAIKATEDPDITLGRHIGKLADLLTKYLDKYANTVEDDGILRFALHQLRSDEGGTISGRFSASGIDCGDGEKIGANPQQILAVEKQISDYGNEFIIKELFEAADENAEVVSADAEQIEYRLFAHYANSPRVLKAYREDPRMSFHKLVHKMLLMKKPDLSYKACKNLNFMCIYGGGIVKLGSMLGYLSNQDVDDLNRKAPAARRFDPRLATTLEVKAIYERELPEVLPMIGQTMTMVDLRGWVKTLTGRRTRFPLISNADGTKSRQRRHKALNGIIQGGAGDIMKMKMVEAHRERKRIGFIPRLTIHDQLMGDGDKGTGEALAELLDRQSVPNLRVPILWAVKTGKNWAACEL